MARFTETSKQAVIDGIDALAVAEDYLRLEKKSGRYWGLCPFHHEKTPSFTVDPDKKTYYCFGCHKGGSILSFVMEMESLSFPEAVEEMSKRFGIPLVYEAGGAGPDKNREHAEALAELYRRVAASFHHILLNREEGEGARGYILGRGITRETIERFKLGYAPADRSWLYGFLSAKGFSESFLASSGLFSQRYPRTAFFSRRLMFPIASRDGTITAFGGRILEGEGPKYINSQESEIFKKGKTLFALDLALPEIRRTKEVYLAEGYMDVIALHQGGVTNAVAPLGTAFTDDQAKLLKRWAERVYLMLDGDEAGQNAAWKAILCCRKSGLDCMVVDFGSFFKEKDEIPKDPAEILQKFGAEALKKCTESRILDLDFVIFRSRAPKAGGKAASAAFLFPYLDALDSEVAKDAAFTSIADALGVEQRAVRDDYNRAVRDSLLRREGAFRGGATDTPAVPPAPFRAGEEVYLLAVLAANPGFFGELRRTLLLEDLEDPRARDVYIALEEWYRESGGIVQENAAGFVDRLDNDGLKDFIVRQEASGAFAGPEKLLAEGMKRIKGKALERKRRDIVRELRKPDLDPRTQTALLAEKVHIDAELSGPGVPPKG